MHEFSKRPVSLGLHRKLRPAWAGSEPQTLHEELKNTSLRRLRNKPCKTQRVVLYRCRQQES
eukprot:2280613-Amphidinium_carterae.1